MSFYFKEGACPAAQALPLLGRDLTCLCNHGKLSMAVHYMTKAG